MKNIKSLGGIIFLTIVNGMIVEKIVAEKTAMGSSEFEMIKRVKKQTYIRLLAISRSGEYQAIRLLSSVLWNGKGIQNPAHIINYSALLDLVRTKLSDKGFIEVRAPSIHPGSTKGDCFELDFFGKKGRLTASNALYMTILAANLGRVYSIQRCFRAEPSKTHKHLSEFDMLEVAFIGADFEELVFFLQEFIIELAQRFESISRAIVLDPIKTIQNVEYSEIAEKYGVMGKGLGRFEKEISKQGPTIVTKFPRNISSWAALPVDDKFSYSLNLLVPDVGEIAEGCVRDTREAFLRKKFESLSLDVKLGWYVNMNPRPSVKVLSFGIGLERLFMWFAGVRNIREISPFFRDKKFSEAGNF